MYNSVCGMKHVKDPLLLIEKPAPMAQWLSSANGLVGTGFPSRSRLQPRAGFLKAQ